MHNRTNLMKLSLIVAALFTFQVHALSISIKDLADISGIRENHLVGYGLVVGLPGTGEKTEYTQQTFKTMLKNFGINLPTTIKPKIKNIAVVSVTATLEAFVKPGQKIDVTVSSLGEAKSLRGGTLLQTFLKGIDGQVYAIAQGKLIVGGLSFDGADGSKLLSDNVTVGRIMNGAIVEKEVVTPFETSDHVVFNLKYPSFSTASLLANEINKLLGPGMAHASDQTSIKVSAPRDTHQRVKFLAQIERIQVEPQVNNAKIIVNSHTGTIVVGSSVHLLPVAITHGSLTLTINIEDEEGADAIQLLDNQDNDVDNNTRPEKMFIFDAGTTLHELVQAVNDVGAAPSDILAILETLKQAGALFGDLEVI